MRSAPASRGRNLREPEKIVQAWRVLPWAERATNRGPPCGPTSGHIGSEASNVDDPAGSAARLGARRVLTGQFRYRRCIISFESVIRCIERMVAFVSRKSKSRTEIAAPTVPGRVQRLALFGPPPLLEGEDAAAYDQLLARIYAAVKPLDIIYEIFVARRSVLRVGGLAVTPLEIEFDPSART